MERRKKGSGRITYVEDRKSPWRATVSDGRGKQKTRFFKTEKEAKAFLRDINADASKLKALTESGVTLLIVRHGIIYLFWLKAVLLVRW